jgi:hypothetical protein
MRWRLWPFGVVLAGALLLLFLRGPAPPTVEGVGPYPGSTVGVARPPFAVLLRRANPLWHGLLSVDGVPHRLFALTPALRTFLLPPLLPGPHRADLWEFGPGPVGAVHWRLRVATRPLPALPAEDGPGRAERRLVDRLRLDAGSPPLAFDPSLAAASLAHARYFAANVGQVRSITTAAHSEVPGRPGYVGAGPLARDTFFGFWGEGVSEVMAFGVGGREALALWTASVYHRLGLVDPNLAVMGYALRGRAGASPFLPVTVLNAGYYVPRALSLGKASVYPRNGQVAVPTTFVAGEVPDPLDSFPKARYPVGFPVTVAFFSGKARTITKVTASLYEDGRAVPILLLTPENDVHRQELGAALALMKETPLRQGARYRAVVRGRVVAVDGHEEPFLVDTLFSTRPLPRLGPRVQVAAGGRLLPARLADGVLYVPADALPRLGVRLAQAGPRRTLAHAGVHVTVEAEDLLAEVDGRTIAWQEPPLAVGGRFWLPWRDIQAALHLPA